MANKQVRRLLLRTGVTILMLILLVTAAGCAEATTAESPEPPPPEAELPVTSTEPAVSVEQHSATLNGILDTDGGETCLFRFEYDIDSGEPYGFNTGWSGSLNTGEDFSKTITGLKADTTYYFRAQTRNSAGSSSGAELSFTSLSEQPPTAAELGLAVAREEIKAPDFALPTLEGSEVTLSDLQGKYVVLNFWATHCPPCVAEMEYFETVGKQHPDKLAILTVDIRESASKVSEFFGDGERSFIVALDNTGEVTSAYRIQYTPTTFFIDTDGNYCYKRVGAFISQQHFEDSVALLLNK
jgi:thiol-disulfide isomerase/thioredoxin